MVGATTNTMANGQPLVAELKVFEVDAQKKSKKVLSTTDQVKPKATLEYSVEYANVSNKALKNLKLNLPLPDFVSYTGLSSPKDVYASLDGKHFEKAPLTRVENGKKVQIPLSEYRALQWSVSELKPKQKIVVNAQARVNGAE